MVEGRFGIYSGSDNKIRLDPITIMGEGGPQYPRLMVPIYMDLVLTTTHENIKKPLLILSASSSLFLANNLKIANSVQDFSPEYVLYDREYTRQHNFEFPLDHYRIEKIEENRRGDLGLRLDIKFIFGEYESILAQEKGKNRPVKKYFITHFNDRTVQLKFEIPQSHWVGKVLPRFGYGQFKILEIPVINEIDSEAFLESFEELKHAEKYYITGEYDKAVEHCRTALEPIKKELPKIKELISSESKFEWIKEISNGTLEWLDKIDKKTRAITSKPHHLPSIGHFSRYEAESIILITISLINYISKLSNEE